MPQLISTDFYYFVVLGFEEVGKYIACFVAHYLKFHLSKENIS